ncbi:hypothetical protein D9758_017327 [Tetrapyrgos nigripes]|uniref:Uncharacterized protein n=1 Tax=Tetrapyrgos nigripes TaxID=182062 RepID=A0A8H5BS27_9AGAR|nr:hypothetical protein D9758_017327 [Tetrapyrgos nigripes]
MYIYRRCEKVSFIPPHSPSRSVVYTPFPMATDVTPDTAAIFALAFEWGFYGISLWMFVSTMRQLLAGAENIKMACIAFLFFVFSTAHVIVDLVRMKIAFIDKNTFLGEPAEYFANVATVMFLVRSSFYIAQTLLADAVVVYRCHVVWNPVSRWIFLIPLTLWMGLLASSLGACYNLGVATKNFQSALGGPEIFQFAQWINAYFSMSLATNLVGTGLLAFRIWRVNRTTSEFRETGFMLPVLRVVIDAGLLYTVTLTVTLIVFEAKSNAQTICLDIVSDIFNICPVLAYTIPLKLTPVISISFYMLILRVAKLAKRGPPRSTDISLQPTSISVPSSYWSPGGMEHDDDVFERSVHKDAGV